MTADQHSTAFISRNQISYSIYCLTTEAEEYVNENNFIVNLDVLKHIIGDHREREETEQRFKGSSLLRFSSSLSNYKHEQLCVTFPP